MKIRNTNVENVCYPSLEQIVGSGYPLPVLVCYRRGQNHPVLLQNTLFPPYKNPQPKTFLLFPTDHGLLSRLKVAFAFLEESMEAAEYTFPDVNIFLVHSSEMPAPVKNSPHRHAAWTESAFQTPCTIELIGMTHENGATYYYSLDGSQKYPPKKISKIHTKRPFASLSIAASQYNEAVRELFNEGLVVFPAYLISENFLFALIVHGPPPNVEMLDI